MDWHASVKMFLPASEMTKSFILAWSPHNPTVFVSASSDRPYQYLGFIPNWTTQMTKIVRRNCFYPIQLTFLVVDQYELQSPVKQILWTKLYNMGYHANLPQTSFCRLRFLPSAVRPLHPFESSQYFRDGKAGMICDERYLGKHWHGNFKSISLPLSLYSIRYLLPAE